jgi:hypothetical protein
LEGKSLVRYFKKYSSIQNKILINYKKIKEEINVRILEYEKKGIKSLTPINDSPRNSTMK